MKFKTKADLFEKYGGKHSNVKGYRVGLINSFNSFKERIDFYKKYTNKAIVQLTDDKHVDVIKFITEWANKEYGFNLEYKEAWTLPDETWNEGLFQYCFGDIE